MTEIMMNPYAQLAKQARALLRLELEFSPEERAKSSWLSQIEFCGTKIVLGKGGANTLFYSLGNGERQIGYPNVVVDMLDRLSRQPYVLYVVQVGSKHATRFDRDQALAFKPVAGASIFGVALDGSKHPAYRAKSALSGSRKWMAVK